jgi:hypothetical protein
VTFARNDAGALVEPVVPQFKLSDIEFSPAAKNVVSQVVQRMREVPNPDAYQAHRLKRLIDDMVTYGKKKKGLGGSGERIVKNLRRNIDTVLDTQFPAYNDVNTMLAKTIDALDQFQDLAPKKVNLLGPDGPRSAGVLGRRVNSNAASSTPVMRSILSLETLARELSSTGGNQVVKFGQRPGAKQLFDDDILTQLLISDELDAVFGPVKRTSLQGQAIQAGNQVTVPTRSSVTKSVLNSVFGKKFSDEKAFKALTDLLKDER